MPIEIKCYSSVFANQSRDDIIVTTTVANTWNEVKQAITTALQNAQDGNHDVMKIKIMRK